MPHWTITVWLLGICLINVQTISAQNEICSDDSKGDISFLIDVSSAVGKDRFGQIKTAIKNIVKRLPIGPDKIQLGMVCYTKKVNITQGFDFDNSRTMEQTLTTLDEVPYGSGGFRQSLANGLCIVNTYNFRPNTKRLIIAIIRGNPSSYRIKSPCSLASEIFNKAAEHGKYTVAFRIDRAMDEKDLSNLEIIAETKNIHDNVQISDLEDMLATVIKDNICKENLEETSPQPKGVSLSIGETERNLILKYHNDLRTSAGINSLVWKGDLQTEVEEFQKNIGCVQTPDSYGSEEGIFSSALDSGICNDASSCINHVLPEWIKQTSIYDITTNTCSATQSIPSCLNYKQMVWKDTFNIGCGVLDCNGKKLVTCKYQPSGNIPDNIPYGRKYRAGCTIPEQTTEEHKSVSLTESDREVVLNYHNTVRSGVGLNSLQWSNMLANQAREFNEVVGCGGYHSCDRAGENVFWASRGVCDSAASCLLQASKMWYNEHKAYNVDQNTCTITELLKEQGVTACGHYTQMVWRDTSVMGCDVMSCPTRWRITCQYLTPGNRGGPPY